jgi:hypothetical protein
MAAMQAAAARAAIPVFMWGITTVSVEICYFPTSGAKYAPDPNSPIRGISHGQPKAVKAETVYVLSGMQNMAD